MATVAESRAPAFVRLFNPIVRRILNAGPLLGPNALLTVRGRNSGVPRTTPVALVEIDGRRWVVATFGDVNWARNLRAAGRATLSVGGRREDITANELTGGARIAFFREVLTPYVRKIRVGGAMLAILGARDILTDPAAAAARRPVFELSHA